MKGFVIKVDTWNILPGHSNFMTLFHDVLDDLGSYYWFCESALNSEYAATDEERSYFWDVILEDLGGCPERNYHMLAAPSVLLPKYARWVKDDMNNLIGFLERPELELIGAMPYDELIMEKADILFNNTGYWACFARNTDFLDKCLKSATKTVNERDIVPMDYLELNRF